MEKRNAAKLAGYRQPAPEVSWAEVEKAVAKSKRSATQIPLVWRRIAAAAMIIFICGSGFIVYYRHADKPHTPNTASLNRGQTVSPATPTAAHHAYTRIIDRFCRHSIARKTRPYRQHYSNIGNTDRRYRNTTSGKQYHTKHRCNCARLPI